LLATLGLRSTGPGFPSLTSYLAAGTLAEIPKDTLQRGPDRLYLLELQEQGGTSQWLECAKGAWLSSPVLVVGSGANTP
jgi:hypothetical protein